MPTHDRFLVTIADMQTRAAASFRDIQRVYRHCHMLVQESHRLLNRIDTQLAPQRPVIVICKDNPPQSD